MTIIKFRKISYSISGALVLISAIVLLVWGLNFGIDFAGGSLLEVKFIGERPSIEELRGQFEDTEFGKVGIQAAADKNAIYRLRDMSEEEHQRFLARIAGQEKYTDIIQEERFNSVGPVIGAELKKKALTAILLVLVMIIFFIAFAFRQVSSVVSSWKYGVVAIVALAHDVMIPTGIFAILGHFKGVEIDTLFITALLTILGFSIHDTIVVFDRVRENLKKYSSRMDFEDIVGASLKQTISRSIATTLALLLVLVSLYIYGAESVKYFSLTLIIGIIAGTYSSIFIASPLLVTWYKWSERKKK